MESCFCDEILIIQSGPLLSGFDAMEYIRIQKFEMPDDSSITVQEAGFFGDWLLSEHFAQRWYMRKIYVD